MNLELIQAAIEEIRAPYADRRVHVFEVTPSLEGDRLALSGKLLDPSQRVALVDGLIARFPGLKIETTELNVIRDADPTLLSVVTNLSSMHAEPSFLAEQVTQLLNGMQVEVLEEQGRWVYVRKYHGPEAALDAGDHYIGWTYRPYLNDEPAPLFSHLVTAPVSLLLVEPRAGASPVTRVLGGTAVAVAGQEQGWANLELAGGMKGWLPGQDLRALAALPTSENDRRSCMMADAVTMTGVPYLWGGCSANGIDCSGFAQLLHRWVGLALPRDADMQYTAGKPVEPPFQPGDLLFFGEKGENRRITHVAVSLGGWQIIHSSRSRNGVHVDDVQSVEHLRESYLCAASYLG